MTLHNIGKAYLDILRHYQAACELVIRSFSDVKYVSAEMIGGILHIRCCMDLFLLRLEYPIKHFSGRLILERVQIDLSDANKSIHSELISWPIDFLCNIDSQYTRADMGGLVQKAITEYYDSNFQ